VLQSGVWSNSVPFTINIPQITSISPTSGAGGTVVTITGVSFGSPQGGGSVWIGSAAGTVVSWGATQVVASVDSSAVSGIVKVSQNGTWSNAVTFTVPPGSGTPVTIMPNVISMVIGDTRSIQALNSSSQPVTGLAWSSSNTAVATLSTDDPPIITAVTAGNVTITAGSASADLTVFPGLLPTGTIIWSNPGDGSGVKKIIPAVPSSTGVADVFALQADGTVQAITSDGTVAWTANVGNKITVPDFQGGLLVTDPGREYYDNNNHQVLVGGSVQKLDGITGQPYPAYAPSNPFFSTPVVHTDGTIFALVNVTYDPYALDTFTNGFINGIDPTTGTQKFSIPLTHSTDARYAYSVDCTLRSYDLAPNIRGYPIVAGDGYAYLYYVYNFSTDTQVCGSPETFHSETHARMLRVGSDGSSSETAVGDWTVDTYPDGSIQHGGTALPIDEVSMITNADQGVFLSLSNITGGVHLITISGGSVTSHVTLPTQIQRMTPVLQAQDGTFFGDVEYDWDSYNVYLASFDSSGNIKWTAPNYYAQIATPTAA